MKRIAAIMGVVLGLWAGCANALVINFDDLQSSSVNPITSYSGLDWSNFYALNGCGVAPSSGYCSGTVSQSNVAYNGFENPASFSSSSSFTVNSLYLTAAWSDGLSVTFKGYDQSNALIFTSTASPSATSPTLYQFNWSGLYKFGIEASGGTKHPGFDGEGTHMAIDDITVNASVPVPTTIALLGLGLVGIGTARRKRA